MESRTTEQPEKPKLSRAVAVIAAAISAFALNCARPDVSKSTVQFKEKITADCTKQKEVDYQKTVYFSGTRSYLKTRIEQCIKGTVEKTGRRSYSCKIPATRLENAKCE